jgi:undecaprenyl-diphosphatase
LDNLDLAGEIGVNAAVALHPHLAHAVSLFAEHSEWCFVALLAVTALRGLRSDAVVALAAVACAEAIARPLALVIGRERPWEAHPHAVRLLEAPSFDPSFPSDGAVAAFAIAAVLLAADRRLGLAAYALAGALIAGRLAVGVHYPTDTLAGALLGTAVGALAATKGSDPVVASLLLRLRDVPGLRALLRRDLQLQGLRGRGGRRVGADPRAQA